MELFIQFLWKSAVLISIFYSFYKVLIQKETYFQSIRFYLLSGILVSFIIPFITIPIYVDVAPISDLNFSNVSAQTTTLETNHTFNGNTIFLTIYLGVAFIFFIRLIYQLLSLVFLISKHSKNTNENLTFIEVPHEISPFSFFKYIVYNPTLFNETELKQVIAHEKIHALQKHSVDTLLANIFVAIQWFNPFAWLYKKEIEQNLEFIADQSAQGISNSKKSYQQLLLKISIPNYQLALANNFYNSLLKKRIMMLQKKRSNSKSQWKLILIVPVLITFMANFSTEVVAQKKKEKVKIEKIEVEIFAQLITKDTDRAALDEMINSFKDKGLDIKLKNIKRNSKDEITSINIDAKAKNGKAAAAYAIEEDSAIKPIKIAFDSKNNSISIGTSHEMHANGYFFSDTGHKKIIRKKIKSGDDESFVFITNEDDDEVTTKVWVDNNGDTTKIKSKKITIKTSTDDDDEDEDEETYDIHIDTDDETKEIKKEVIVINGMEKGKNMVFISDDEGGSPLYIVDGKKVGKKDFEKISAETIEKVEVLKGNKATEKYGQEAKDGVIIITTKKR